MKLTITSRNRTAFRSSKFCKVTAVSYLAFGSGIALSEF